MIIFNETNVTAENRWGRRCVCVWGSLMDCRPSIFFWIGVLINYIDIIFLDQVLTLESLVLPITSNFHWNWLSMNHWNWQLFDSSIENGYLTGFSEDGVWDGPFQYRLKGFSLPPTDFYPRPYFLDVARRTKLWSDRCINNRNIAQIHLEYVRCVFDAFPKKLKFFVSFSGKVYKALFKLSIIGFLRLPFPTGKKMFLRKQWDYSLSISMKR